MRLKCPIRSKRAQDIVRKAEKELVKERIRCNNNKLDNLKSDICDIKSEITSFRLPSDVHEASLSYATSIGDTEFKRVQDRHKSKLERLIARNKTVDVFDLTGTQLKKWVVNRSKHELTPSQSSVLAKGLNFNVSPTSIPTHEIVEQAELACVKMNLNPSQRAAVRNEICGALKSAKPPRSNVTKDERLAVSQLQKLKDVLILLADKGRATVLMDKSEYESKMNEMLCDTQTYEVLKKDPSNKYRDKLISILKRLHYTERKINHNQYMELYPTTFHMPRIYGSPKIHKDNCPLRPIVEGIGSVTYALQKSLKPILKPIEGDPEFYIKDSKDLVKIMKDIKLEPDEIIISHDVVGLFTNVSIDLALKITEDKLRNDTLLNDRTNLMIEDIMELLSLVLRTTYFSYDGKIYQQKFGVAMGGPISPIIANIVMDFMFKKYMETVPAEIKPRLLKKFVDDSVSIVKEGAVTQLTSFMNGLDPTKNLSYTCELPENCKLPCLDLLFHKKDDGTLKTTVYRKKTHTDQYLNFSSHHPLHHKQGVIRTLLDRADALVSEAEDKKAEYEHVSKALMKCGYPKKVITDVIKRRQAASTPPEHPRQKPKPKDMVRAPFCATVPYVQGLSESVQRIFKRHGISCALKPTNKLRSLLVHPKDPRPKINTSHCVYKIPCANCPQPYIGETERHLYVRVKEHSDSVAKVANQKFTRARASQSTEEYNQSACADHVAQRNHVIDFENASVLATHCHTKLGRQIRESIWVRSQPHGTFNRNEGGYELSRTWDALLQSGVTKSHLAKSNQS